MRELLRVPFDLLDVMLHEYTDFIRKEMNKWGPVVKASGATID